MRARKHFREFLKSASNNLKIKMEEAIKFLQNDRRHLFAIFVEDSMALTVLTYTLKLARRNGSKIRHKSLLTYASHALRNQLPSMK